MLWGTLLTILVSFLAYFVFEIPEPVQDVGVSDIAREKINPKVYKMYRDNFLTETDFIRIYCNSCN